MLQDIKKGSANMSEEFLDKCVSNFNVPVLERYKWFSWDDFIVMIYILLNFVILVLSTVKEKKKLSEQQLRDINTSQIVMKFIVGGATILLGIINIVFYTRGISHSMSNRLVVGILKLITGIAFVIYVSADTANAS